ncbi:MAG: HPr family phosphocarrier protein [Anaerolineae bacterium]|nr:HPr family phosphocarrier protein [Anaerolineae bacterium]
MVTIEFTIMNESGLHARPASDFVMEASSYKSDICIRNSSVSSEWVDAKSILSILGLGVESKHKIEIKAEGEDEVEAIQNLKALLEKNINEKTK